MGAPIVNIKFLADLVQFSTGMQNASRKLDRLGKKFQQVGKKLTVSLTAPLVASGLAAIKNFDKQAKAIAQVERGIKTTGNAAGFTSEQLQAMASSLQDDSLFGDEEILKGVTSQLLTFTNIANDQFRRTQEAALDLATRLDGDLKSASIQLGKALNDPVANLSALSRSGIQFSKAQKQTINSLARTNRLAEAQTIILDELEKQYGGSAAAAAEAGTGSFKQLGNIIGDISEDFGRLIVDALKPTIENLKEAAKTFQGFSDETKKTILVIAGFVAALGPLIVITGTLIRNISTLIPLVKSLSVAIASNPIGAFAIAITALAGAFLIANSRLLPLTNATEEFNKITGKATKSIAKEKSQLDRYLRVAKNDKLSKEQRLDAIKKLNNLSPKYLSNLTLETINTEEAKKATDDYVESLLIKAKVLAAQDKLVEVQKRLLDLQLGQLNAVKPSIWQNLGNALLSTGNASQFAANTASSVAKNLSEEESQLKILQDRLTSFITDNEKFVESLNKANNAVSNFSGPDPTPNVESVGNVEPLGLASSDLAIAGLETDSFNEELDQFANDYLIRLANIKQKTQEFSEALQASLGDGLTGAFQNFSSAFVDSLGLAEHGLEGFAKSLLATVTELISMFLAQALASAIAGAVSSGTATGPGAIFTTPAFIAAAIAGVIAAFASIPKFETGGVVGGSSFHGDRILARLNSGELVLNQNQQRNLSGMLGNRSPQPIVLGGGFEIEGTKLRLLLKRTDNVNKRLT